MAEIIKNVVIEHFCPRAAIFSLCVLALNATTVGAAYAIPDWKKDGRPGYPTRDQAVHVAQQFTAPGAPRAGLVFRISADPDGGYTPVFYDPLPRDGAGV